MMESHDLPQRLSNDLKEHVKALSHDIGERGYFHYQNLERAAAYVFHAFQKYGYDPAKQFYRLGGKEYHNIIAVKEGSYDPGKAIIAGAHYDTVRGTPGADDNASGIAGILELSRLFKEIEAGKTIKFIAFVNEEPPFFRTSKMGSRIFARQARKNREDIIAMLSFEMIGYFSEEERSQHYPLGIRLGYPDRANFISVVGDLRSFKFIREIARSFRKHSSLGIEAISMPRLIPGVDFSDHWSFWKEGYRAAMITDTAFYRFSDYHSPFDTSEKLDYCKMAQVVEGFYHVLLEMSL